MRIGPIVAGVALLTGCSTPVPVHDTPGWDDLVRSVRTELESIEPVEVPDPVEPVDPIDPAQGLTLSSPNAVETNLADLVVGECLLYPYDSNRALEDVVQVVPCDEPHYGEVYATGEFADAEYSDEFDGIVATACEERFDDYVGIGYWSSVLYYDYSYVSEYGWQRGLRGWRCYAVEPDYENEGSVRGTGR